MEGSQIRQNRRNEESTGEALNYSKSKAGENFQFPLTQSDMRKKLRVYLDTSVISALFDKRNPERRSLTESFFFGMRDFEPYISEITVAEIQKTPDSALRQKMIEVIPLFSIISLSDEVEDLTKKYIYQGAVPKEYREDAYHIAIATLNEMDYLLSWNFKHIVRRKTRDIVRMVNSLNNLKSIEIMTPAELL